MGGNRALPFGTSVGGCEAAALDAFPAEKQGLLVAAQGTLLFGGTQAAAAVDGRRQVEISRRRTAFVRTAGRHINEVVDFIQRTLLSSLILHKSVVMGRDGEREVMAGTANFEPEPVTRLVRPRRQFSRNHIVQDRKQLQHLTAD